MPLGSVKVEKVTANVVPVIRRRVWIAELLFCSDGAAGHRRTVDKTAKEEDKADEQYDTGHATVKSVSFSHTGCLTHKRFLEVCPTLWTVLTLRHNRTKWSILRYVKSVSGYIF